MRLLTPFEFINLFPEGKSLVFVGNAPSLNGQGLGSWIDSHDIVVRFNVCPVAGYEQDVGSKTTILVSNPYPEDRKKPSMLGITHQVILVITPQTRRGDLTEFENWAGDTNVLFTYAPDIVGVGDIDHKAGLTTGTYALQLLPRLLQPNLVSVTGFTMFMKNSFFHYFSILRPKGIQAHDLKKEAEIFIKICNNIKCSLEVTEDIIWIAENSKTRFRKDAIIRKLPKGDWKK
ncbi:MAG: glycosyltransferase family 29 protein [Sedimentisphaerales bacterium]|nr:glycosyltransferase family 29 protein [Sedimentisphaerales bacterium]